MDIVVFDIETRESFSEVGQYNPEKLSISVVGAYSYLHDQYQTFFDADLNKLWAWLENAELIVGFNSNHFDIPILAKYWPQIQKIQSLDLLTEIKKTIGYRVKLDQIATGTLGTAKTADGLEAIKMFKEGNFDRLAQYCLDDVRITKEIYEFGKKEGRVWCSSFPEKKEILVNFKPIISQRQSIELTLGI